GCPKLLNHAYQGAELDRQLTESMTAFLQDRTRNYFDAASETLYVSKIFDWFEKDFVRKFGSLSQFMLLQADALAIPADQRTTKLKIKFTDYDWKLNDSARASAESGHSGRP
ncbi:MAG TPA: hypothetical protein VFM46_02800, partial [Pseudomonadales bacterium]|nr:hypothetical protein [Pseudomonadales bacterium]